MKIHSYYENLGSAEHEKATLTWKECWAKNGWEPVVHGPQDMPSGIVASDDFPITAEDFLRRANGWKTKNRPEYELACWKRWLIASVTGGAWCDYDVLPVNFQPKAAKPSNVAWSIEAYPSCGIIHGSPGDYQRFVAFAFEEPPIMSDHHSDMYAWQSYAYHHRIQLVMGLGHWYPGQHWTPAKDYSGFVHIPFIATDKWAKFHQLAAHILR